MEIVYKVGEKTFTDKKEAEVYEKKTLAWLVARKNMYKHFYLPLAFKHYKHSLGRLHDAREYFRIKSLSRISELHEAHEEWLEKKRILRERIAEYRNTKELITQLSTAENAQKNKKTESKK